MMVVDSDVMTIMVSGCGDDGNGGSDSEKSGEGGNEMIRWMGVRRSILNI